MAPAEVIVKFRCPRGHSGQNAKCLPCNRSERQVCGYCAEAGDRVDVTVTIVQYLT